MLRASMCLVLLAGLALVVAATGGGQSRAGGKTLTYRDLSGYRAAVAFSIQSWNDARSGVRFVLAAPGSRPDFTIRRAAIVRDDQGREVTGRGGPASGVVLSRKVLGDPRWFTQYQTIVVTHEVGHVLGLPHSNSPCSSMNPSVYGGESACPGVVGDGYFRCGPSRADARAVARRHHLPAPPATTRTGFCRTPAGIFAAAHEPARLRGESESALLTVRNTGRNAWHGGSVFLELLDTEGLSLGGIKLIAPNEETETIVPGGSATFGVGISDYVCPGAEIVFRARLLDVSFNTYIGATATIRIRTPAPPLPRPCQGP